MTNGPAARAGWQSLWGQFPDSGSAEMELGQHVIVIARWMLIGAGLVLTLMPPAAPLFQLRIQLPVILCLAVANFFLHAHLLRRQPTPDWVVYAASAADLAVVTTLVVLQNGFASGLYIFYLPALAAVGLAFPRRSAAVYTVVAAVAYAVTCSANAVRPQDLVTRLAMLVTVAACAAAFRAVEKQRRTEAARLQAGLTLTEPAASPSPEPAV